MRLGNLIDDPKPRGIYPAAPESSNNGLCCLSSGNSLHDCDQSHAPYPLSRSNVSHTPTSKLVSVSYGDERPNRHHLASSSPPPDAPKGTYSQDSSELRVLPPHEVQQFEDCLKGNEYQYSMCTGVKKALLIGINYRDEDGAATEHYAPLAGCHNDVDNMRRFLLRQGFLVDNITVMKDLPNIDSSLQPTSANIRERMGLLVSGAQAHDSIFFFYSGHGGQVPASDDETEIDGMDETIIPVDLDFIKDDDMHNILVKRLPMGARLTAIFDSCHSGTALDLPYIYNTNGELKICRRLRNAFRDSFESFWRKEYRKAARQFFASLATFPKRRRAEREMRIANARSADVIMFSGSKDEQTATQLDEDGHKVGALTSAFIRNFSLSQSPTFNEVLVGIRNDMRERKKKQLPQLSCSHPLVTSYQFLL